MASIPRWQAVEFPLTAPQCPPDPLQDLMASATFRSPDGRELTVPGFWDGDREWLVRFAPDEPGEWSYALALTDPGGTIVDSETGSVHCIPPQGESPFARHGPIRLAANGRYLCHADGHPFFWLADTAWNGPLRSTAPEWHHYLATRSGQGFSAVQWVATQWRSAPEGDRNGHVAYGGGERLTIFPAFFRRLERRMAAVQAAGLLNAPVLLWANPGGDHPEINPGIGLPTEQAVALARYMVARWHAWPVFWILSGDAPYEGENGEKWRQIGRRVFGDGLSSAPVAVHCVGRHLPIASFQDEGWLDVVGYQSGHGDSDETWQWLVQGPPAQMWRRVPFKFYVNLEPAYENHLSYHHRRPHSPFNVRKAVYWSLLNAPTAGVTYGGHGVWGWDDGSHPPVDHPNTGVPLPWPDALLMPGARQMAHVQALFTDLPWWELVPAPELLAQPGSTDIHSTILVSRTGDGSVVVAYTPAGAPVPLEVRQLPQESVSRWFDPRRGTWQTAHRDGAGWYPAPDGSDWVLVIRRAS